MSTSEGNATVALLTPPGEGGISVIQLAGTGALEVLRRSFRTRQGGVIERFQTGRLYLGYILDASGEMLDEVIVYSGPHWVEVNCHGGELVTRRVMARLVELGARERDVPVRPADDRIRLEAWEGLLRVRTPLAAAVILDQYHGALQRAAAAACNHILEGRLGRAGRLLDRLLVSARFGTRLLNPPQVAILGRPNVGKSTLLNALLGRQRALVHPTPGTTRDYLDELIEVEGLPVVLMDTAGIRPPEGAAERAGVELALEQARRADLVLLLFDGSEPLRPEDRSLLPQLPPRELLPVINKADLPSRLEVDEVRSLLGEVGDERGGGRGEARGKVEVTRISALTGEGLAGLRMRLVERLFSPVPPPGEAVVFTPRQREVLSRARSLLSLSPTEAADLLRDGFCLYGV